MTSEATRRWVHLLFGSFAFLLPYCDWRLSFLGAFLALFVNSEILRRATATKHMFRENEGWTGGIILYPFTIAVLILIYRQHTLPIACAWLALAAGDPAAAFWGRRTRSKPWPWNPSKSIAGSGAFVVAAFVPVLIACKQHGIAWPPAFLMTTLGTVGGSLVESYRWAIADNVAIGLTVSILVGALGVTL